MSVMCCCAATGCGGSPATKPFHVLGCSNAAVSGATVSLTGAASLSGTTDASGNVSFSLTVLGTYNFSVSMSGYTTQTGSFTLSSGQCGTTLSTANITLSPDSSHFCSCSCCTTLTGGPPYLKRTWPTTLTLNDGIGNVTLTYTGSGASGCPNGQWTGTATRHSSRGEDVTLTYTVECQSTGVWCAMVSWTLPAGCGGGFCSFGCDGVDGNLSGTVNCDTMAISLSGTVDAGAPGPGTCTCGDYLGTIYGVNVSHNVVINVTVTS